MSASVPCTTGVAGCTGGTRNLDDGSIAQLYADTGVFWTGDGDLTRNPATQFLRLNNGLNMDDTVDEPRYVQPIKNLLGITGDAFAHNAWDWLQTRAYGIQSPDPTGNTGQGNTPHGYGSPVAGPETHYPYEASDVGGAVRFDNAFMFKYSRREHTKAARWPETVSEEEKARRLEAVITLQQAVAEEINTTWVGRDVEVLVEGPARRRTGWLAGKSAQFKTTVFPGKHEIPGDLVQVRVTDATAHTLLASA